MNALVELRNLTKTYQEGERERTVLQNANACIFRGQFAALLGPSGSGKSTLLNLISGIDTPTSGEVIIDSRRVTTLSEKDRTLFRRHNIGFIFQFFNLIPTLTVLENLSLPLELTGRTGNANRQRATELLSAVGLEDRAESFPDRLSGGEQQRVAVARALVHDPFLILADEPTGNLDTETGAEVIELLNGLVREHGKTLIIVTHSADVVKHADRLFSMRDGRLQEHPEGVAP